MVDSVKNYGIAGVGANVELGKQGAKIIGSDSSQISFQDKDGGAENVFIASGTGDTHGINKTQLDEASLPKVSISKSAIAFNSGTITVGEAQANCTIHSVTVESSGAWANSNATTEVTVGDDSDNSRLFAGFDDTAQVKVEPKHKYTSATDIKIFVTQGGATAGSGTAVILFSGKIN